MDPKVIPQPKEAPKPKDMPVNPEKAPDHIYKDPTDPREGQVPPGSLPPAPK